MNKVFAMLFLLINIEASAEAVAWTDNECRSKNKDNITTNFCGPDKAMLNGLINTQMAQFASAVSIEQFNKAISTKLNWRANSSTCQLKPSADEQISCIKKAIFDNVGLVEAESLDTELVGKAEANTKRLVEAMKTEAYLCLYNAIDKLDDDVSPADIIAKGASSRCRGSASKFVSAMSETLIISDFMDYFPMTLDQRESLTNRGFAGDRVVQMVLESRAEKRAAAQQKRNDKQEQQHKKQTKKKMVDS